MLLSVCLLISLSVFLYTYLSICKPIVRIVIVRIPIPKFNFLLMLLTCRRASENVDCYPKWTKNLLCLYQGEKSSLYFFKETIKTFFIFSLSRSKTILPTLGNNNYKKIYFEYFEKKLLPIFW